MPLLSSATKNKLDNYNRPIPFPPNPEMILQAGGILKGMTKSVSWTSVLHLVSCCSIPVAATFGAADNLSPNFWHFVDADNEGSLERC